MKFFIACSLALVASVSCVPGIVNTGNSAVSRSEDGHGNYAFGYNEDHATGGSFRKEQGGPGMQVGSYGLRDADGRMRVVSYVADAHGFRASVSTNEPGVDPKQDPAAMSINGHGMAMGHAAAAAPIAAYGGAHALPISANYAFSTQHVSAAPILAKSYAAPIAAPAAYAAAPIISKSYAAAPILAAPAAYAAAPIISKSYAAAPIAAAYPGATYSIHAGKY